MRAWNRRAWVMAVAFGCAAQQKTETCQEGYELAGPGQCFPVSEAPGMDTPADTGAENQEAPVEDDRADSGVGGGVGGGDDTSAPWEPVALGPCAAPAVPIADPIEDVGFFNTIEPDFSPSSMLVELVAVQLDPIRGLLWGVGQGGLIAFDISDAGAPTLVAQMPEDGHGRYYNLHVLGADDPGHGIIYTTHRDLGMTVTDTRDLGDIGAELPSFRLGLAGMTQVGDRLYVAMHDGRLLTMDISSRLHPVAGLTVDGMTAAWTVLAHESVLFGADNVDGVVVFDLADPDAPVRRAAVSVGGGVQALAVSGDTLFAAAGSAGVVALDISTPLDPVVIDAWRPGTSVQDIAVDGDTLWAVTQEAVIAVDISNPASMQPIASRETPYWAMAVDAAEGTAWVGDWGAVRGYRRLAGRTAPDVNLVLSEVMLDPAGETLDVRLENLGSASLVINGLGSDHADLGVSLSATDLAPGAAGTLRLSWPGGDALDTTVCVSSNDPDVPILEIEVHTGIGGSNPILGMVAPAFVLPDLDGVFHSLSDYLGHPVVLVYFATW